MPPKKKASASKTLEATLWDAADELPRKMDSAQYKHVVLGLIFLKYVSDTFMVRHAQLSKLVDDPDSDYFMPTTSSASGSKPRTRRTFSSKRCGA